MQNKLAAGKIAWRSPSNIALIKYWGKLPVQIPANPSLSMTLSRAYTEMTLEFRPKDKKDGIPLLEFMFEGHTQKKFETKIALYIQSLFTEFPFLDDYSYKISSSNTFPHSTGIASSASSMSALGLCLAEFLSCFSGISKKKGTISTGSLQAVTVGIRKRLPVGLWRVCDLGECHPDCRNIR